MKKETQKWLRLDSDDDWQVIIPDFDSKPHANKLIKKRIMELAWLDCPCKPRVSYEMKMIVHNSFIDQQRIEDSMQVLESN